MQTEETKSCCDCCEPGADCCKETCCCNNDGE